MLISTRGRYALRVLADMDQAGGDGYLPLCKLARILLDRGYDGYFAIEHYGHGNQEAAILRSAENLLKA